MTSYIRLTTLLMVAIALALLPRSVRALDLGVKAGTNVVTHIGSNSTNTDTGAGAGARTGGNVSGDIGSDANPAHDAMAPASDDGLNSPPEKDVSKDEVKKTLKKKHHMKSKAAIEQKSDTKLDIQ